MVFCLVSNKCACTVPQLLGDSDIDPDSPEGEVVAMMREATTFMGETLNDVSSCFMRFS